PLPDTAPVEVAVGLGADPGAVSGGVASRGAERGGAELGGAGSEGVKSGGAEPEGAESEGAGSRGAEPGGAEPAGVEPGGAEPESRTRLQSGAAGAGVSAAGDNGAGDAGVTGGAGGTEGAAAGGPGGARTGGTGAAETGGVGGAGAGDPTEPGGAGAVGAGTGGTGARGARAGGAGAVDPGAGVAVTSGLTERREPASRPASPIRTGRRVPRPRPPPVPGTHTMALRPSSVPLRVPLPPFLESSLPALPDPEFHRARAASPTVSCLFATVVTDPSFMSTATSALVVEQVDFAAACRLDDATTLVAESESASPPSVEGECALGTDDLEDRQEDFEYLATAVPRFASMLLAPEGDPDAPDIPTPCSYVEAITGPYSSQWHAAMDAEMASWKSTCTYFDAVPPSRANIVDGMWIFRVKRPPGSPPAFKARYVAQGFSQRQGVDYFQTFSPTPKMTTLRGSLHEEIWLRRPPSFIGSFPTGTQWSLWQPVYGLRQAPREWHNTLRTTLAALGFTPSTADPSLFLRTNTPLPPFYVLMYVDDLVFATADTEALTLVKSELQKRHTCTDLGELRSYLGLQITCDRARRTIILTQSHMVHQVLQRFDFQFSSPQPTPLSTGHSLSAPPWDESVEPNGPYAELVGCLITSGMGLVLGGRGLVVLAGHADASWVDDSATQRSTQGYTFSLGSGSVSWRSTRLSSVLSSSCEGEIYAGAMAAQELRWITNMLIDLVEQPSSPPVLYVDNKAMIALCQEHRLEHRSKHIALRYFLARELHQRGQLRLAYVATRANTADIFTKALPPEPSDCAMTAFRTRYASFGYTVMPFGLTNEPATFQMTMNEAFRPLLDKCVIIYLDDILVYKRDKQQHIEDMEAVFKVLDEHKLLTKGSKCEFFQDRLEFLGHTISEAGVEIDSKKLDTVKAWHPPTNITELQSFLGFVNYVRRFVPDMARLTAPLTDLLRKNYPIRVTKTASA
ncbi:unnamed protein product, partial [Closterium sp. NIES-53]